MQILNSKLKQGSKLYDVHLLNSERGRSARKFSNFDVHLLDNEIGRSARKCSNFDFYLLDVEGGRSTRKFSNFDVYLLDSERERNALKFSNFDDFILLSENNLLLLRLQLRLLLLLLLFFRPQINPQIDPKSSRELLGGLPGTSRMPLRGLSRASQGPLGSFWEIVELLGRLRRSLKRILGPSWRPGTKARKCTKRYSHRCLVKIFDS